MQSEYGVQYARLYREHWWWQAREAIVIATIRRFQLPPDLEILDVGCGDALSFPALSRFGSVRGIEIDDSLLDPGGPFRDRIETRPLGDSLYNRSDWRFDLITALDVVEHISDDHEAVGIMVRMLRPKGVLIVTVPAFQLLWDHHDEINHHYRRYTLSRLREALSGHGLNIVEQRYVFRSLFAPKLAVRLLNTGRQKKVAQYAIPRQRINSALIKACLLEDHLLRQLPIPFGTSALAVARIS